MSRIRSGHLLFAIGAFHTVFGLFIGYPHIVDIIEAGVFNAVTDDQPWRMAIFWFEFFGLMAMLTGSSWAWAENRGLQLPRSLAVGLAMVAAAGVVFIPISGFWLLFGVAALVWRRAPAPQKQIGPAV